MNSSDSVKMNKELKRWINETKNSIQENQKIKSDSKKPKGICQICGEKKAIAICIKCGKAVCKTYNY